MPFWCQVSSKDPLLLLANVDLFSSFSWKKLSISTLLSILFFLIPGLNSLILCMQH